MIFWNADLQLEMSTVSYFYAHLFLSVSLSLFPFSCCFDTICKTKEYAHTMQAHFKCNKCQAKSEKKNVLSCGQSTFQKWLIIFKCHIQLEKVQSRSERAKFHLCVAQYAQAFIFMCCYTLTHTNRHANTNQIKSNTR